MTLITDRPPEFDARVVAFLPALRRQSCRLEPHQPDDLVNDTVAAVLTGWRNYREPGNFHAWLVFMMRGVAGARRRTKKLVMIEDPSGFLAGRVGSSGGQEAVAEISQALGRLAPRQRRVMVLLAQGNSMSEVGAVEGVSKQRVAEIVGVARRVMAANDNQRAVGAVV